MNTLQETFDKLIRNDLTVGAFALRLAEKKLAQQGKSLSDRQRARFKKAIDQLAASSRPADKSITISIPDSPLDSIPFLRGRQAPPIVLDVGEIDVDAEFERIVGALPSIIREATAEGADILFNELLKLAPKMATQYQSDMGSVSKAVSRAWSRPLQLLATIIMLAIEAGDEFNSEFRPEAAAANDAVFEAITRLHARACQVAGEVHALLSRGYADGAHARWRSLHEINTVALLLSEKGNATAERYLLHEGVDSHRAAKLHQAYAERLGYEPLSDSEFSDIAAASAALMAKYGPEYANPFGWAADALDVPDPKFADIEKAVELEHLRPLYKMASYNVHADPKGILFRLGLYPAHGDVLLAGPSTAGLADPGQSTAISLAHISTTLLLLRPNIDRLVMSHVFRKFADIIGYEFVSAQKADETSRNRSGT